MPQKSIHEACRRGDIKTVRALIEADPADVDADDEHDWRPIFHAGLCRHEGIVRLLIEAGADLAAHDGYVMHYAGEVPDNKAIVSLLIQYGGLDAHVRPTSDLSRQFLAAVFLGDTARVHSLLNLHQQLGTTTDGRGDRPIHHAARNGDTEIVRLLIEHGANVNDVSENGNTVLYCAGGHGHLATVQLLLSHGADCDVKFTKDGKTLLQWLLQFQDDQRFKPIINAIQRHNQRSRQR